MSKKLLILITLALILGGVAFILWRMDKTSPPVAVPQPTPKEASETPNETEKFSKILDGEYSLNAIDTSNWKTYRNEKYGFEVKYPENWETGNPHLEEGKGFNIWFAEKGKLYAVEGNGESAIVLSISFKTNPHYKTTEEFLLYKKQVVKDFSVKKVTDMSIPMYYSIGYGEGIQVASEALTNYSLSLTSGLGLSYYPEVKDVLHGMISTIKIIKK